MSLRPELTVLVGENNGGKSNVIDAMRLLTLPLNGRRDTPKTATSGGSLITLNRGRQLRSDGDIQALDEDPVGLAHDRGRDVGAPTPQTRCIFADGREWPRIGIRPVGKWIDLSGSGRHDVLEARDQRVWAQSNRPRATLRARPSVAKVTHRRPNQVVAPQRRPGELSK
jgi:predicted ATPase